jgi:F-type H+-transporting ATPase subunit delta
MSHEAVARRYARAVFELGKESSTLPALLKDLSAFSAMYDESDELELMLTNPLIPETSREAVVAELGQRLSLSTASVSTLRLLARRGRMPALSAITVELARLVDDDANVVRAEVTSAVALTAAYAKRLQAELEQATGHRVVLTQRVDPSLIAGVVTRIGDRVIDGSARARLAGLRESLLRQ